ncbi:hypothetical protein CW304_30005 [Bacillus sp. UFRGS-B20]|nr:hypothetical protein CW304_30005 [Bacillus sp. UFRGS-B20]
MSLVVNRFLFPARLLKQQFFSHTLCTVLLSSLLCDPHIARFKFGNELLLPSDSMYAVDPLQIPISSIPFPSTLVCKALIHSDTALKSADYFQNVGHSWI